MKITATVTEVMRSFSDYVSRVAYRGERFVLTRGGKPVAELVPAPPAGRRLAELPGLLASLPHLSPEEAAQFEADIDRARASLGPTPAEDAWAS